MNKVLKGLVAVAATAAMAIAGVAGAASATADEATYTITVNNTKSGHAYEAYQVFSGTLSNDTLSDIQWGTGVNEEGKTHFGNAAAKAKSLTDTNVARAFAKEVSNYLSSDKATSTENKTADGQTESYTISNLTAGYYFVKDTTVTGDDSHTSYIMKVVKNTTATPKSVQPTVDKKVKDEVADKDVTADEKGWGNTADHAINESFQFKLTATIPADTNLSDYKTYQVKFNDTMSKGVTFEKIDSVKVNNSDVTAADYTLSSNVAEGLKGKATWDLTIADITKLAGVNLATTETTVEVIYSAHLNEEAQVNKASGDTTNANSVNLEYSNNPNGEGFGKTADKTVYVFTYEVDNTKVKGNAQGESTGNPLQNAGFRLYSDQATSTEVKLIYDETLSAYRPVKGSETAQEMKSAENGKFNIVGLDAGTYYLKETTTPAGYNTAPLTTVTIVANHQLDDNAAPKVDLTLSKGMNNTIVDVPGSDLPETGGMGTTILYAAGAAIVLVAAFGIAFAVRRRNAR